MFDVCFGSRELKKSLRYSVSDPSSTRRLRTFRTESQAENPGNCSMQDPVSGLMWSKRLADESAWHRAIIACVALSHNGRKAGTWRLPTKDELRAAAANGIKDAASGDLISSESGFDNWFWSASSVSGYTSSAYIVDLASGSILHNVKYSSGEGSVVCVR